MHRWKKVHKAAPLSYRGSGIKARGFADAEYPSCAGEIV
jgi:hypothetical protein